MSIYIKKLKKLYEKIVALEKRFTVAVLYIVRRNIERNVFYRLIADTAGIMANHETLVVA